MCVSPEFDDGLDKKRYHDRVSVWEPSQHLDKSTEITVVYSRESGTET